MCLPWSSSDAGKYNPFYILLVLRDPLNSIGSQYKILVWAPGGLLYFRATSYGSDMVGAEAVCFNGGIGVIFTVKDDGGSRNHLWNLSPF